MHTEEIGTDQKQKNQQLFFMLENTKLIKEPIKREFHPFLCSNGTWARLKAKQVMQWVTYYHRKTNADTTQAVCCGTGDLT